MEYVVALIALVLGAAAGFFAGRSGATSRAGELEATARAEGDRIRAEAERLRADAERVRADAEGDAERRKRVLLEDADSQVRTAIKTAELDAEKKRIEAEKEADRDVRARRAEIEKVEARLTQREEKLDERALALDKKQNEVVESEKTIARNEQSFEDRQRSFKEREATLAGKLEAIAGLSREDARQQVIDGIMDQARLDAARSARQLEETVLEEAEKRAKKVLATTIQRYAGEYVVERSVSVVNLPSEDMKGRLIGREGRNIRALEAATGCDFIIDDTPETMVISAFDPVRREIARQSIERLMADGRIHPARIEEIVEKVTSEMEKTNREAGEAAAFELGLTGLHPEILRYMGRLKYRTSYGQNIWAHSIEVGFLCGLMAGELGLNVKLARRAGFLHDIGKAMDHSDEGGHAIVGANFIKKYGEDELIVNAVGAHHDEIKPASVIAHLVIAGDALSGARPGARREVLESYVKRLEDLERISLSFPGVEKCFAIQAGREIRVMVSHERINDDQASMLVRDIARKIEQELTYPGQIRVTVIREMRATEIAR